MPEPGERSEADEAVRDARDAVISAGWSFGGPNRGPSGRDSVTRIEEALDAFEAAIRASERAKVEALVEVAEDALVYFDLKPHDAAWKKARFRSALDAVRAGRSS